MTSRISFDKSVGMGKIQELRDILTAKIDSKAITQTGLAKATGVDQASINRFYKKGEGLSAENFIRLSEWVGARILWPGESSVVPSAGNEREIERLLDKIQVLSRENALLNKLVAKYEDEERIKKEAPESQETYTTRAIHASDSNTSERSGPSSG